MQGLRPIDSERKHISSFEWALMQDKMNPPLCRRSIAVRISFMFQFSLTLILFTLCKSESSANLLRGSEGNGFKPARRWQNTAEITMNHLSNMKRSMRHCICMSMRGYSRDKFTQGKSDREGTLLSVKHKLDLEYGLTFMQVMKNRETQVKYGIPNSFPW